MRAAEVRRIRRAVALSMRNTEIAVAYDDLRSAGVA
jgi:hypothetical protein